MSDASTASATGRAEPAHWRDAWVGFWFSPRSVARISLIRGVLCAITIVYFLGCWSDLDFWYREDGPLSSQRVSTFIDTGGLEDAATWIISPLFLTDSLMIYRAYLVIGIILAIVVITGRGGRVTGWLLWLFLVGWVNRSMILAGLSETLLSLGLFAAAIAPPGPAWKRDNGHRTDHWTAGFSQQLIAVQITLISIATFMTMLAGSVWFNGIGAYALAAPVQDRTIDWTAVDSILVNGFVHESLTHLMIVALPIGCLLAWLPRTSLIGKAMLIGWCIAVALLGSHWLYAMTFAAMVTAIRPAKS